MSLDEFARLTDLLLRLLLGSYEGENLISETGEACAHLLCSWGSMATGLEVSIVSNFLGCGH